MKYLIALLGAGLLASSPLQAAELACGDTPRDTSRIAVVGGSLTEILYALERQDRIVAVDSTSTFPSEAKALPQLGYVRAISAEGLLSLEPTLVLGEHDMGPPEVVAQLEALDIDILRVPEVFTVEGIRAKVRCVAAAVDARRAGEQLMASAAWSDTTGAGAGAETVADAPRGMVLIGVRSGSLMAAGRDTSGAGLLAMSGLANAMEFSGWKQVSLEAMVSAAPEFIIVSERAVRGAGGLDAILDDPILRLTPAVRDGRVLVEDGMAMLGFGPRTAILAKELQSRLADVSVAEAASGSIKSAIAEPTR